MACGAKVTAMSQENILFSLADWVLNPATLKKWCPSPLGCTQLGYLSIHDKI